MNFFTPKPGTWTVSSEKDPRWNGSGFGYGLVSTGGPRDIQLHIEAKKLELGAEPPDDLEVGFWKD